MERLISSKTNRLQVGDKYEVSASANGVPGDIMFIVKITEKQGLILTAI